MNYSVIITIYEDMTPINARQSQHASDFACESRDGSPDVLAVAASAGNLQFSGSTQVDASS